MSATIYIVDPTRHAIALPRTLADFGAILEQWAGRDDEPNPKFVELGKRLEAKFPPPEAVGDESVWVASPAAEAADVRSAIWNLGLPGEDMIAVERVIATAAGELGLIAYDDQIGIGFLPGGEIAPEDRRALWEESLAAIDSGVALTGASAVRKLVLSTLDAVLAPYGFKLLKKKDGQNNYFVRVLGPVRQELSMRVIHDDTCEFQFCVYHQGLKALSSPTYENPAMVVPLALFHPGPERHGDWVVRSRADLRPLVELMQQKLLPLANLCRDLHGIDQLLNDESADTIRSVTGRNRGPHRAPGSDGSKGLRDDTRFWPRLVIAHLAGNPHEAEVAAQVDAYYPNHDNDWYREYARVKEALKAIARLATWRDEAHHRAALRPIPASLRGGDAHPQAGRMHHWEVAFNLQQEAQANPQAFWEKFAAPGAEGLLVERWNAHAATLPAEHRLPADGLRQEFLRLQGADGSAPVEMLLLSFPHTQRLDEMSHVAVARTGSMYLVHTYENFYHLDNGIVPMVFVYTYQGTRASQQHNTRPSLERFLEYIRAATVREAARAVKG